jgi:predicted CoA-substrate-specific enzyme activase
MITAGIDMGAKTIKVVIMDGGKVVGKAMVLGGVDTAKSAEDVFARALKVAGLSREKLGRIVATGAGRKSAKFSGGDVTEVSADARGGVFLFPNARTLIDVGAEESRGIRVDERGRVVDFATNEKCAAGAGLFTEAMSRTLEVKIEELGPLALKSLRQTPMNAQCVVFAESEVVSLVHARTSKEDIAKAVLDAIAGRVVSMVSRVGLQREVLLMGGVARNVGFVQSLKKGLRVEEITLAPEPEYVGAIGAALLAAEA